MSFKKSIFNKYFEHIIKASLFVVTIGRVIYVGYLRENDMAILLNQNKTIIDNKNFPSELVDSNTVIFSQNANS